MEEADALCDRIGIMVSGQLKAIGSNQHLKKRFGDGFQLDLNVNAIDKQFVLDWLSQKWPKSNVIEAHFNTIKIKIHKLQPLNTTASTNDHVSTNSSENRIEESEVKLVENVVDGQVELRISSIFASIEENKEKLTVKEYSVSEITLEQIFIHFAAEQEEEKGKPGGEQ